MRRCQSVSQSVMPRARSMRRCQSVSQSCRGRADRRKTFLSFRGVCVRVRVYGTRPQTSQQRLHRPEGMGRLEAFLSWVFASFFFFACGLASCGFCGPSTLSHSGGMRNEKRNTNAGHDRGWLEKRERGWRRRRPVCFSPVSGRCSANFRGSIDPCRKGARKSYNEKKKKRFVDN